LSGALVLGVLKVRRQVADQPLSVSDPGGRDVGERCCVHIGAGVRLLENADDAIRGADSFGALPSLAAATIVWLADHDFSAGTGESADSGDRSARRAIHARDRRPGALRTAV